MATFLGDVSASKAATAPELEVPAYLLAAAQEASEANVGLWDAASNNDAPAAREWLSKGANVNYRHLREEGHTPLHRAVLRSAFDVLALFLDGGEPKEGQKSDQASQEPNKASSFPIDVNLSDLVSKNTALHVAAAEGSLKAVRVLIDHGADVNATNKLGNSPLHLAASGSHLEVVHELIHRGASAAHLNNRGASTALFAVSGLPEGKDSTQLIAALLSNGADPNAQDHNGTSALHVAATRGLLKVTERIIAGGADVTLKDSLGHDPAWYATFKGHVDVEFAINSVTREEKKSKPQSMTELIQEN